MGGFFIVTIKAKRDQQPRALQNSTSKLTQAIYPDYNQETIL